MIKLVKEIKYMNFSATDQPKDMKTALEMMQEFVENNEHGKATIYVDGVEVASEQNGVKFASKY